MSEFKPISFGKYLLLESIAVGGMAQLYRAKIKGAEGFEKLIAIKRILPHLSGENDLVNAFIDEAKLAALLNHQNIVQIYDFGLKENSYFIAMEYLIGKDLRYIFSKAKEKNTPLGLEHALYITSRTCAGLDYAHKLTDFQGKPLNLIHRDISPPNILITYEGEVKIVDFGIAKAALKDTVTQNGLIKGKVAYMSPEQASGAKIDHRSDIFSAGILLYEMATGKRMFAGETLQVLERVRGGEFEPPEAAKSGLPPKVYEILRKALAKEIDRRYQSCGEMLADVEECMFELSLRHTARGLAEYMKTLFQEEIKAENRKSQELKAMEVSAVEIEQERGIGEDLQVVKEILQRAKAMSQEEPSRWTKPKFLYGALGGGALLTIVLIWMLLFKGTPMNAADKGTAVSYPELTAPAVASKGPPSPKAKKGGPGTDHAARVKGLLEKASRLTDKNPKEARSLLLKAIELDPQNASAQFQLGLTFMALKDSPKAIEAYRKAVELDPQHSEAYFNLGFIYATQRDFSRAEEAYGQVVRLAPPYLDEALFNLALVQEKQGKKKHSKENLEWALKVNPRNEIARKYLDKLNTES
jgi:serine/threonine protein kinase/Tfp pilus assembly protein PilF